MEIDVRPKILQGKLIIPPKVLKRLEDMKTLYAGGNEYAMFLHAEVDMDNLEVFIDEDIYDIPYQTVNTAHVSIEDTTFEIDETTGCGKKPLDRTLNTAVHRHPDGCSSFSGEDQEYINSVNGVSFLYQQGYVVPDAVINVPWGEFILPLKLKAYVQIDEELIPIDRRHYRTAYQSSFANTYGAGTYLHGKYIPKYKWDSEKFCMVLNPDYAEAEATAAKEAEKEAAEKAKDPNYEKTPYDKIHEACDNIETGLDINVLKERINLPTYAPPGIWNGLSVQENFQLRHQHKKHKHKKKGQKVAYQPKGCFTSFNAGGVNGSKAPKPMQIIERSSGAVTFPRSLALMDDDASIVDPDRADEEAEYDNRVASMIDEETLDVFDFMSQGGQDGD